MQYVYGLKPDDRMTVMEIGRDPEGTRPLGHGKYTRKCTVIREYLKFILADFGVYRESINKANIICKDVLIWKGWEEE